MATCAVVTGASSGIGRAVCEQLAEKHKDMQLFAVARSAPALELLVSNYANISAVQADLATKAGRDLLGQSLHDINEINLFVHSAATVTPLKPLSLFDFASWQAAFDLNVGASMFLTQAFMSKFKRSRVLFVTSEPDINPVSGAGTYCITKIAQQMLCRAWQAEVDPAVARFALASPGMVDTPMQQTIREADPRDLPAVEVIRELHRNNQLLRATDVAQFLCWLLVGVDETEFDAHIWDIYNPTYQPFWQHT